MSQAATLLNNMVDSRTANNNGAEPHIVVSADRFITVPAELKRIAVQGDHNIETVTFDCPRYWDTLDLDAATVYINYMLADGTMGSFLVENKVIDQYDSNTVHFDWTVSGNVTKVPGKMRFLVCAKVITSAGDEIRHWHSEISDDAYISEGLEAVETIVDIHPDIITQILARLDVIQENASKPSKKQEVIASINNGITVIDSGLKYADGVVEIKKIDDILWITDSCMYNLTSNFNTLDERTVFRFSLPKELSIRIPDLNGDYVANGTVGFSPAIAYEHVTYTRFNCHAYIIRSEIGTDVDTFQLVYSGTSAISGGGLCAFYLKMPLILNEQE